MSDEREVLVSALAGRYAVGELLGRGGMGSVFLGTDLRHDRPVAIKVLRPEVADATSRARFEREIATVASLRHPHILPLLDSGAAGELRYLVTPYVEGETLRERLDREVQLSLDETLSVARDVAEALVSAHEHGVIHRDIKPSNILLSEGHALVADFGVARAVVEAEDQQLSRTGMMVGSAHYVSPEQASGERDLDGRTDIYALGCVVHEMLAGEPPFTAPRISSLIAKHVMEPAPSLTVVRPGIPSHVAAAVRKALEKAPADRYAGAMDFLRDLAGEGGAPRATFRGGSADSRGAGTGAPGTRRWVATGILAGVVAAVALIALVGGPRGAVDRDDGEAMRELVVVGYQSRDATVEEGMRIRAAEDELTRLLSGWKGLRVVPRSIKDGLRAELGLAGDRLLTFPDALELASRTGAGTLVTLEPAGAGGRAGLQAQLYRVDAGEPAGDPIVSASGTTDATPGLAPIAAEILDFEGPPEELARMKRSSTDLEAIRQFYAGRQDLERWRLDSAERRLRDALERDSLFGLAHHLLAMTLYWQGSTNPSEFPLLGGEIRRRVSAARRLTTGIGGRDSAAVEAFFHFQNGEYPRARRIYESLVEADSTDVYAWLGLGSVEYRDPWTTETADGQLVPRGSFNRARDAFIRTARMSPDFYLGFGHLFDVYNRIAAAARSNVCYGYERPGPGTILIWETQSSTDRVAFCPVVRDDSINFVDRSTLAGLARPDRLEAVGEWMDAAIVELRRWADYAPDSPWPQKTLADWHLERARLRAASGAPVPWAELLSEALPYAERALTLADDTVPGDLVRVANLRLALGDLEGALDAVDRAVGLVPPTSPALPAAAANPLLATGQMGRALAIATAPNPGQRTTLRDDQGNRLELVVPTTLARVQVYGGTGFDGAGLGDAFEEIESAWTGAGYTEAQRITLRRWLTPRIAPALALDRSASERWFRGWTSDDPWIRGLQLADTAPGEARALLDRAAAELGADPTGRAAYLTGLLARRLGEHAVAVSAFEVLDGSRSRLDMLADEWGLATLSHLQRGRAFEALGDTVRALNHYRTFDEWWNRADPELSHLRTEALDAIAGLRGR